MRLISICCYFFTFPSSLSFLPQPLVVPRFAFPYTVRLPLRCQLPSMNQDQTPIRGGGRTGGYSTGRGRGRSNRGFRQSAARGDTSAPSSGTYHSGPPRSNRPRQTSWRDLSSSIPANHAPDAKASSFQWRPASNSGSSRSKCTLDSTHEEQTSSLPSESYSISEGGSKKESKLTNVEGVTVGAADTNCSLNLDRSSMDSVENLHDKPEVTDNIEYSSKVDKHAQSLVQTQSAHEEESSHQFDICPKRNTTTVNLKPSLLAMNREKRNEMKRSAAGQKGKILRPGMVLLKGYFSISEQVQIVKLCRDLGLGSGGFYEPTYRNGAKINLKMMCLGKNWDPEKSEYGESRPFDGAKPPPIPDLFLQLVERVMKDSNILISEEMHAKKMEHKLPSLSPDICIVNFYTKSGRLGLHQDRDESAQSLREGLPVVSFSIGDSAEFLYCDERDESKAENVILASGDVLIFGGKSRHVFHGVSSIQADTAPRPLVDETNLRPGRLNLTFRQY